MSSSLRYDVIDNVTLERTIYLRCWKDIPYFCLTFESKVNLLSIFVVNILTGILGTIFNAAFLYTTFRHKRFRQKISSWLLINLASIDFVVASVILILNGTHIKLMLNGDGYCKLRTVINTASFSLSAISFTTLTFITLDSYIAIVRPFFYKEFFTPLKVMIPLWIIWIVQILMCILTELYSLWTIYQIVICIVVILAILFYILAYTHIFKIVTSMRRKVSCVSCNSTRVRTTGDRKTIVTSVAIVFTFMMSYLPVGVYNIFILAGNETEYTRTYVYHWLHSLRLSSALLNVFVYYLRLSEIKQESLKIFLPCCVEKIDYKQRKESYLRKVSTTRAGDDLPYNIYNETGKFETLPR